MKRVLVGILLGGVAVAQLTPIRSSWGWATAQGNEPRGGSANGIIALTGLVTNNVEGLWVVQTNAGAKEDGTPGAKLLLYLPNGVQGGVKLAGARDISYDLHPDFLTFQDSSPAEYQYAKMKEKIQEIVKKKMEEGMKRRGP